MSEKKDLPIPDLKSRLNWPIQSSISRSDFASDDCCGPFYEPILALSSDFCIDRLYRTSLKPIVSLHRRQIYFGCFYSFIKKFVLC
jgi:hypothetical protein